MSRIYQPSGGGPARAVRESGGPTVLTVGPIADGEFAKRVGTSLVGAAAAGDLSMASSFVVGTLADAVMPPLGTYVASNGTGAGVGTLRLSPVAIGSLRTMTGLALGVAGNVSGAVCRLGLYECGTDGYPGALLYDSGSLDASSTNTRLLAQPVTPIALSPTKRYMVAFLGGVAAANVRLGAATNRLGSVCTVSSTGAVTIGSQLSVAQAFGALPATAPAGMSILATSTMPLVCLVGTV